MQRITSLQEITLKDNVHLQFNVMKKEYSDGWYNRRQ